MILPPPRTLASGSVASFESDDFVPGAVQLVVDDTPQSHLNPGRPDELFFEYVRRIGHVIDLFRPKSESITAIHLGGGAFTLPRYVEATRPGSRQQVVEIEGDLVDYVRESFPLPERANIRVRRGDARERLERFPAGLQDNTDLVVVDVFSGAQTPAHLTSVEFYRLVQTFLTSDGVVAVNAADGSGQHFAKRQVATLQAVFSTVVAIAEPQVLKGRRFGNVVLVAANSERAADTLDWLPRLLAGGPHPARLLEGEELRDYVGSLEAVTDATAQASPLPPQAVFGRS